MRRHQARVGSGASPRTSKYCTVPIGIQLHPRLHSAGQEPTLTTSPFSFFSSFRERFATVVDNYKTTRAHGGTFILLIHDLWGADGTQNSSAAYPGDNGDWTSWDAYLTQLFSDLSANSMTTSLVVDIWNEPDLTAFWARTQAQYLQMWGRTYYKFR